MPMKDAVLQVMRRSGAFAPFRLANRSKTLVLVYHRFSAEAAPGTTSARDFAEQLAYLRARYTIVPLSLLEAQLAAGRTRPGQVAITIDDGYRDVYTIAFPMLRRFHAPATLFAVTDFIDGLGWIWTDKLRFVCSQTAARRVSVAIGGATIEARWSGPASALAAASRINEALKREADDIKDRIIASIAAQLDVELPACPPPESSAATWSELREMNAAGITIGSHTVTHPIVTQVSADRLADELRQSRARLEEMLGQPATQFAYPNGTFDRNARDAVERAGYGLAVTMEPGFNDASSDRLALRRIHTETDLARFIQSTSGFEQIKNRIRSPQSALRNA
jgi:peptidoglycan/xylan/chitin deacetylase (PgdA/CDA1 family)